ncbi:MAG: DUF721 domain-containing protein [Candidatus Omnitrophica bacterium]|nr:DUF721 domain-containing protein [Candidatus Omnitrophota bacterium]
MTRENEPLKDIVARMLSAFKKGNERGKLVQAWHEAAGPAYSRHTEPVSFNRGRLVIVVSDSPRLYELTLEKKALQDTMNTILGKKMVREIRFKIGTVHTRGES